MTHVNPESSRPSELIRRPFDLHFGVLLIASVGIGTILVSPGASLMGFIDYPTLIFCVGIVVGILLIAHGSAPSFKGLAIAYRGTPANHREARLAIQVCEAGLQSSIVAGVLEILIGLIIMLGNMADPSAIGPAMAVALLGLLYGTIFACGFLAGRFRVALAAEQLECGPGEPSKSSMPLLTRTAILLLPFALMSIVTSFFILLARFD